MRKEILFPALGIAAGELMMFSGYVYVGLAIHIINLQAVTLALVFGAYETSLKNALQSLLLLLQMRIINLAMPQFFTITLLWYPLIYGVMFLPIYYIVKNQQMSLNDIGMNFKKLHIYLPLALLIGASIALIEFYILRPAAMIENISLSNIILISTVMFVFVAAIEELIFRSILQTRFEKIFGSSYAILLSGILFGIMHAGYGLVSEIIFASLFGIVLGIIFQKTRSFPFILTLHGFANILLFGILPIIRG